MIDAVFVLERLRSIKSADELAKLKVASEAVIDSMMAVIAGHGPGATKREHRAGEPDDAAAIGAERS